jgi:ligand-binding sensor domain-containing protein
MEERSRSSLWRNLFIYGLPILVTFIIFVVLAPRGPKLVKEAIHISFPTHFYTIVPDPVDRNLVWFGTNAGVRVYDKNTDTWKAITVYDGLRNNVVMCMVVLGKEVWFGTWDGICVYDKRSGTWRWITTKDGLPNPHIRAMAFDRWTGEIWVGTDGGGAAVCNPKLGRWERYGSEDGLPSDFISSIGVGERYVWFGTSVGEVTRFDKKSRRFVMEKITTKFKDQPIGFPAEQIVVDGNNVWLVTSGSGVTRLVQKAGFESTGFLEKVVYTTSDGLADNRVYCMAFDSGTVWFGTYGGVNRYTRQGDKLIIPPAFYPFVAKEHETFEEADRVESIAVDGDYVWAGTFGYGVGRFDKRKGRWEKVAPALMDNYIGYSFLNPSVPEIWFSFGYRGYGANVLSLKDWRWRWYGKKDGLPSERVRAVVSDGGKIWFATWEGALELDRRTGKTRVYTTANGLPGDDVNCIAISGEKVCFGTISGLAVLDKSTGVLSRYLPKKRITACAFDNGKIWVGTDGFGILLLDPSTGDVETFKDKPILSDGEVSSIALAGDSVWVGFRAKFSVSPTGRMRSSGGGVARFDKRSGKWRIYRKRHWPISLFAPGLPNNNVTSIFSDGKSVWIGMEGGGGCRIGPDGGWKEYGTREGLKNMDVMSVAFYGGYVWFGTKLGVVGIKEK